MVFSTSPPAQALRLPPALQVNDEVALFSPSSHTPGKHPAIPAGVLETLQEWGLRVRVPKPPKRHLYLAGNDAWRAQEFTEYYMDPSIKALFATRGGYGTARMLPWLNPSQLAKAAPKAVVGMSDVTALFCWLKSQLQVGALHGPCLCSPTTMQSAHYQKDLASLHARLFFPERQHTLPAKVLHWPSRKITNTPRTGVQNGQHSTKIYGTLTGGCLTVLASLSGCAWALKARGSILLLEDVGERPYRLDRCLTQLRQSGALEGVCAVVFGWFSGCAEPQSPALLQEMWRDVLADAPFAVAQHAALGHGTPNCTVPLGRPATLEFLSKSSLNADCALVV